MKGDIPSLDALLVLTVIVVGFIAFYIGAKSSSLYVIIFEVVSVYHGYVINTLNSETLP